MTDHAHRPNLIWRIRKTSHRLGPKVGILCCQKYGYPEKRRSCFVPACCFLLGETRPSLECALARPRRKGIGGAPVLSRFLLTAEFVEVSLGFGDLGRWDHHPFDAGVS